MNLLTKEKSGGNRMDEKQDFTAKQDIVDRLIVKIIYDEKENLKLPYSQRTKENKMIEKIYKDIVNEVSRELAK